MIFLKLIFSTNLTNMLFHIFRIWEYDWNKKRSFSIANFPNLKKKCYFIFFQFGIYAIKKNILYFPKSYRLTLFPSGGPSRPPLVVFRVLHICWMTYVRSPYLVTFPKYYRLTLFPSGRAGGFSCAAHLLIDLRSPNLVTFPNFWLRIGWCTLFPKSVVIGGSRTGFRRACSGVFDTKHSQG